MNVVWSPLFMKRLQNIVDFISAENINAAFELADEIDKRVAQLALFPKQGRLIQQIDEEITRELVIHKHYILVYAVNATRIHLITIRHSKQKPRRA